jgi:hypothetical protein
VPDEGEVPLHRSGLRKEWYGGPFRAGGSSTRSATGLAINGLLKDDRQIYYDFQTSGSGGGNMTGSDSLVPSKIQPGFAAQALADVLKANFNPTHLEQDQPGREPLHGPSTRPT